MTRHRPYMGRSEAQSAAEYDRTATYAGENAASWQVAFDRPRHEPRSLRGYVNELRAQYASECPSRLHEGPDHVDAGGTPRFTSAFEAFLYASAGATDRRDTGVTEVYQTPLRACLAGMGRAQDERTRRRASIGIRVSVGGQGATEAAISEGVPAWCAETVAEDALARVWRNLTGVRLSLPKRENVA